jgi:hypothetical protein
VSIALCEDVRAPSTACAGAWLPEAEPTTESQCCDENTLDRLPFVWESIPDALLASAMRVTAEERVPKDRCLPLASPPLSKARALRVIVRVNIAPTANDELSKMSWQNNTNARTWRSGAVTLKNSFGKCFATAQIITTWRGTHPSQPLSRCPKVSEQFETFQG